MAIKRLEENVEIVQTLSTYPNQEDGLSDAELKAKFDEGAKIIKDYLNDVVVNAVQELENDAPDTSLRVPGKAADAFTVGEEIRKIDSSNIVKTTEQIFTEEQKAQARENIGAAEYGTLTLEHVNQNGSVISQISVTAEQPEIDDNGYVKTGVIEFFETNHDGHVQLAHIADGTKDDHAATVGQLRQEKEKFFEVTTNGVLSLKPEYGAEGSKNAELPKNLVIPNAVDGVTVTSIAASAFAGNLMVESISVPDTVEAIPDNCFSQCYNLKLVSADSVKSIGKKAFESTSVEVADFPNVTSIGSAAFIRSKTKEANFPSLASEGMGSTAFGYCLQLESVNAGNLTKVPDVAFYGCCNLQTVSSNVGITSIGLSAFVCTPKLATVDISKAATDIQAYAFYRSGFEYDWSTLHGCAFGICATSVQLNPTDIWTGLTIKECENPLPTLFNQAYSGWANKMIGETDTRYGAGCVLFAFIHAYCGLYNMKLESVEDFESIANSYEEGILDKFATSMSATYPELCPAFGLSYKFSEIKSQENLQEIYDALADGKYVIVNVGQATSNDYGGLGGHIVLLYGVRKDGKLLVSDSGIGNDSLHGNTSAIHYKHFLHTDKVDGAVSANATDYYIISNGEPSMNTIDEKLDALLQNASFRAEHGVLTCNTADDFGNKYISDYIVDGVKKGSIVTVPCTANPKLIILRATENTQAKIVSLVKNGTYASGQNPTFAALANNVLDIDLKSNVASRNRNAVYYQFSPYGTAVICSYSDGLLSNADTTPNMTISTFYDEADAEYEWTAFYWND